MEVRNLGLQVLLIGLPRHTIDSHGRPLLQIEERFGQASFADMMQQSSQLERAVLAGSFTHAGQTT
jgi:hypothetical protein